MTRLRGSINFENAFVTLVAFLALTGGVAYAAGHLGRNSVGKKQLKASSVTAKKIRAGAVTAAKIKAGAITGAKVKDGAIELAALDAAATPFTGIVHSTGSGALTVESAEQLEFDPVPLTAPTYTQAAGETVLANGSVRLGFAEGCAGGAARVVFATLVVDVPDPTKLRSDQVLGEGGVFELNGGGPDSAVVGLSSFEGSGIVPAPAAPTNHTLGLLVTGSCETAGTITLSDADIDLVGIR